MYNGYCHRSTHRLNAGLWIFWMILFCAVPVSVAEELPLPQVVPQLTQFRLDATVSPEKAFERYAVPTASAQLKKLGSVLSPASDPMHSWKIFFGTSVASMTSLTTEVALTMFYNPWADVALLCEWQKPGETPIISDVELICGDVLRKSKTLDLIPLWRRSGEIPPPLAVMVSTSDSVKAFLKLYGKKAMWGGEKWRKKLTLLKKKENAEANSQVVGFLFNQVLAGIGGFFNDPRLSDVRSSMDRVRDLLIAGNTDAVLTMASESPPESRTVFEKTQLQWENATVVQFVTDAKNAFVFMADLRYPEYYACFWFTKSVGGEAKLKRVDFLSHTLSAEQVDALARQAGMKRP